MSSIGVQRRGLGERAVCDRVIRTRCEISASDGRWLLVDRKCKRVRDVDDSSAAGGSRQDGGQYGGIKVVGFSLGDGPRQNRVRIRN